MVMKSERLWAVLALPLVCVPILFGSSWLLGAEMASIDLYQRFASPVMGYVVTCRFTPSCSHYAVQALQQEGFWRGNILIAERLMYCSPLGFFLP
jgi:putative membrane protein insertion efficiency factor